MPSSPRRFLRLPWRPAARIQAEVDEELRFELDMRAADLERQGVPPDEARRRAVAEFGDLEATRRYCAAEDLEGQRAERRTEWRAELWQDVRLAWRGLSRTPGFTLVVLATLALGIGANTAVFSVVRQVLLDRLPYHEPDRLVRLYGGAAGDPEPRGHLSALDVADLEAAGTFTDVAPFGIAAGYTHVDDRGAEMWQGMSVGGNFFPLLGARALVGRTLDARDTDPGAAPAVLLSHGVWQRTFGGDPGIVGRAIQLNGRTHAVAGVMGPDFVSPTFTADIWLPLDLGAVLRGPRAARQGRVFRAIGRLPDGVTATQLRSALHSLSLRARDERPELREAAPVNAVPLRDAMVGQVRPALLVVMGGAALVLLLACANVAALVLARATARRRELTVRAALGAGRGRLVRQLLTESVLLGVAGGALGVALAFWGRDVLVRVAGPLLPATGEVAIDGGVLAFAVAVALLSGVAFGLAPALAGSRVNLSGALAESARGAAGGRVRARLGRTLVGGQVALAVVLLVGAGLLGRTLVSLERTGVGFDTAPELLTFRVNLPGERYVEPGRQTAFFDAFAERLRGLPGVQAVGMVGVSPWNGGVSGPLAIDGRPEPAGGPDEVGHAAVSEGYFAALAIPMRAGRAFTAQDRAGAPPVALVSESLARQHWPGASPIGRRIRVGHRSPAWHEVVGVVGDVRPGAGAEPQPTAYLPMRQEPWGGAELVVRTAGDAMALVPAVRGALRELDPALPLVQARTMATVFEGMVARQRLPMLFLAAFALLALVLAALGVYGVLAYTVTAREREFGIRAALGATRRRVLALVLRQGMAVALAGTALGLAAAATGSRVLAALLVGVTPLDPLTFAVAPLVLLAAAALACLLPAWRATRVEPLEALRGEA